MAPIWTLEARDSYLLEMVSNYMTVPADRMQREILMLHQDMLSTLGRRSLNYESFRTALVPQNDKTERAFLFDTTLIDDGWYGYDIATRIVPALNRDLNCSILAGDLILDDQDLAFKI